METTNSYHFKSIYPLKALEILIRPLQNLKRDLTSEFGSLIFPFRAGKTLPAHHVLCCAELQSLSTHSFFYAAEVRCYRTRGLSFSVQSGQ